MAFAQLCAPAIGFAQCHAGQTPLVDVLSQDQVALVFSGWIASRERTDAAESVTFNVERVWKGPATEQTVIHVPLGANGGQDPLFDRSGRYVVIAHRLSAAERQALGVANSENTFGTDTCGDGSRHVSLAGTDLGAIGPGHAPVDQRLSRAPNGVAPPLLIRRVPAIYPDAARAAGIAGAVIVEATVDTRGKVVNPRVVRSIPLLDKAAIDSVSKWEYLPGILNGEPVPIVTIVVVTFGPQ